MTSLFGEVGQSEQDKTYPKNHHELTSKVTSSNAPTKSTMAPETIKSCLAAGSFKELGLLDWICESTRAMGFRRPTDIQGQCIPAVLAGRDVMGCAETGSGKTAAFALPILHSLSEDPFGIIPGRGTLCIELSEDPFGIYAVVLTPTRELAMQISDQFIALGALIRVRVCLVIGGMHMTEQALELARKPHIVFATPGRLRAHLMAADPPVLKKVQFLVLDEADRLLTAGFESELAMILESLPPQRKTLLFSATLTPSLAELEKMAMKDTLRFDLTTTQSVPKHLVQQYLFLPAQVKNSYLVALLKKIVSSDQARRADDDEEGEGRGKKRKKTKEEGEWLVDKKSLSGLGFSMIIFVSTCRRCQEISDTLNELDIRTVCLHSMLSQSRRSEALSSFRNQTVKILVATDVASRGLDIPAVDIVINFDIPKIIADYVHRVGRTARAGKRGRSVTMVTQYDVELVRAIEEHCGGERMELCGDVSEEDVVKVLNSVSKASRTVELRLMESGFEERVELVLQRKRRQNRRTLRRIGASLREEVSEKSSS